MILEYDVGHIHWSFKSSFCPSCPSLHLSPFFSMTDVVTSSRWKTSRSVDATRGTTGIHNYCFSALVLMKHLTDLNILFCSLCSYFGFITKHPMLNRFACHVFVSQESMRPVAECVGWVQIINLFFHYFNYSLWSCLFCSVLSWLKCIFTAMIQISAFMCVHVCKFEQWLQA